MNPKDRKLNDAFRALDEVEREEGVSPDVAARLRAQVRSIAAARRRARIHRALATAATLMVAGTGAFISRSGRVPSPAVVQRLPPAAVEETTEFMPLAYSSVPTLDGQIVRLTVPRSALVPFGLAPAETIDSEASRATVLADVLVGEDGLARAVRFVRAFPQSQEKPR